MDINISGHHIEITDALRAVIMDKLGGLDKFDHEITNIDVILTVEKERQKAAATVNIPHTTLHADATTDDMYSSIDELVQKLKKQISEYKKKHDQQKKQKHADKRNEI